MSPGARRRPHLEPAVAGGGPRGAAMAGWRGVAGAAAGGAGARARGARVVFLGTPACAAPVLGRLAEGAPECGAAVVGVVTQPGAGKKRGKSPVALEAADRGLEVLQPPSARDPEFLARIRELAPDLCVTAAYGNFLPREFLDMPPRGTLNIHPSLLPLYRGAAPVQRALERGDVEGGVSLAYSVLEMDAGPVLASCPLPLPPEANAHEVLDRAFAVGTDLLLDNLPGALSGEARARAREQDAEAATQAPKLDMGEAELDFAGCSAQVLHNKVRAFFGWPGTWARFLLRGGDGRGDEPVDLKVIRTRVGQDPFPVEGEAAAAGVQLRKGKEPALLVRCSGGTTLEVLQMQPPTKKPMDPRSYYNGLRGRVLALP